MAGRFSSIPSHLLQSVLWKSCPYWPSQSWSCIIIFNPFWTFKSSFLLLLWVTFSQSIVSSLCWVNFHVFDKLAVTFTRHAVSCLGQPRQSVFMRKSWLAPQSYASFKASDPPSRVTLPPSQPCPFSCKRLGAIYKEMYAKFFRPGWLDKKGNPPTRDNSSPYKQTLRYIKNMACFNSCW